MTDNQEEKKKEAAAWQKALLPFMSRTIVVLSIFFFVASLIQLIYLHKTIANSPQINMQQAFSALSANVHFTNQEVLASTRLKSLVLLETSAMQNQYFQANMLLMGRLWTSYIGFVTGMIMAVVGAAFILGKLREPVSELNAKTSGHEMSFKTASPGLLLAVLGTALMITTLVTNHKITASHAALYLHDTTPVANSEDSTTSPPLRAPFSFQDSSQQISNHH